MSQINWLSLWIVTILWPARPHDPVTPLSASTQHCTHYLVHVDVICFERQSTINYMKVWHRNGWHILVPGCVRTLHLYQAINPSGEHAIYGAFLHITMSLLLTTTFLFAMYSVNAVPSYFFPCLTDSVLRCLYCANDCANLTKFVACVAAHMRPKLLQWRRIVLFSRQSLCFVPLFWVLWCVHLFVWNCCDL